MLTYIQDLVHVHVITHITFIVLILRQWYVHLEVLLLQGLGSTCETAMVALRGGVFGAGRSSQKRGFFRRVKTG